MKQSPNPCPFLLILAFVTMLFCDCKERAGMPEATLDFPNFLRENNLKVISKEKIENSIELSSLDEVKRFLSFMKSADPSVEDVLYFKNKLGKNYFHFSDSSATTEILQVPPSRSHVAYYYYCNNVTLS